MPSVRGEVSRQQFLDSLANRCREVNPREVARGFPVLPRQIVDRGTLGSPLDKGYDQVWTEPALFASAMRGLGLPEENVRFAAYDPAVGTGSAWVDVADRIHLTGVEIDPLAARVARLVHPKACIVEGDLLEYRPMGRFDLAGGGAPLQLSQIDHAGVFHTTAGDGVGASDALYLESAFDSLRYGGLLFAVLPHDYHGKTENQSAMRYLLRRGSLVARIRLHFPVLIGADAGRGEYSLYIYSKGKVEGRRTWVSSAWSADDVERVLHGVLHNEYYALGVARENFLRYLKEIDAPIEIRPIEFRGGDGVDVGALPVTDAVEARIIPNGGRIVVVPNGQQAAVRLEMLDRSSGAVFDSKRRVRSTRWRELLREPWEYVGEEVIESLRAAGITPVMTDDQVRRLERRRRWAERQLAPFEQMVWDADKGEWVEHWAKNGVRTRFRHLYDQYVDRLKKLGMADVLYPYQVDDIARMAIKDRILLGSDVGIGKSIEFIGYVMARGIQNALVVCNSRLVGKWADEFEKWQEVFPHLDLSYNIIKRLSDIGDVEQGRLKNLNKVRGARFSIVSLESLWRIPSDSIHKGKSQVTTEQALVRRRGGLEIGERRAFHVAKYSLASHLRPVFRNGAIMVDEAYKLKSEDANQVAAVYLLQAKHRIAACATPIRNYVHDILGLAGFVMGERSLLKRRYGFWTEGEKEAFVRRFGTYVYFSYNDETRRETKRMIPKIANPAQFREMFAPVMIRRVRNEPDVAPYAGVAAPNIVRESIELSPSHREYYARLITEFQDWWEEYLAEARDKGREINASRLLAKLRVLQTASTVPQSSGLTIKGRAPIQYEGGLTNKQRRTIELVRQHVARGEKVVVFCQVKAGIDILADHMRDLNPICITGDVSLTRSRRTGRSKRDRELARFRFEPDHHVLLASQKALCEGYDIPEASVAIFHESDWTPSVDAQALGRLRRPQQRRPITCYVLTHEGTVDEYVALISGAKGEAHAEVLDDASFDLDLSMLPDYQDYANGILDGLTLDNIKPSRWISRIEAGDLEVYNAQRDGLLREEGDIDEILDLAGSRFSFAA